MNKKILVIAAHADDETLGCGGTIARHNSNGDSVHILFLSDGVSSRNGTNRQKDTEVRRTASIQALQELGVSTVNIQFNNFPDNALDSLPRIEIARVIESTVAKLEPKTIYTHHAGDLNIDHRYAFEATMVACRPQPGQSVKAIYSYEVSSSTGWFGSSLEQAFAPNVYVDIEAYWPAKKAALCAYKAEMRKFPHARSIEAVEALITYRGTQVGLKKAEAFSLIRLLT